MASCVTTAAGFSILPRQQWQPSALQPLRYDNWGQLQSILYWPAAYPAVTLLQHQPCSSCAPSSPAGCPQQPCQPPEPVLLSVDATEHHTARLHLFIPQQLLQQQPGPGPPITTPPLSTTCNSKGSGVTPGSCSPGPSQVSSSLLVDLFQDLAAAGAPAVRFSALPSQLVPAARAAFQSAGYTPTYTTSCWRYSLTGPVPAQLQQAWEGAAAGLGPGLVLDVLQLADLPLVNDTWTFKSPTSAAYLRAIIQRGNTSCIRPAISTPTSNTPPSSSSSSANNSNSPGSSQAAGCATPPAADPLSAAPGATAPPPPAPLTWVLEVEPGGILGVARTLPAARRCGHATRVLAALLARLAAQQQAAVAAGQLDPGGQQLTAYVVEGNTPSQGLLSQLGLQVCGGYTWLGFEQAAGANPAQGPGAAAPGPASRI